MMFVFLFFSAEMLAKLKEQEQAAQRDQMKQLERQLADAKLTPSATTSSATTTLSVEDTMAKLTALQQRFVAGKQKLLPESAEPLPTATTAATTATTTATTTVTATTTNTEEIRIDEELAANDRGKEPQMSESSESEGAYPLQKPLSLPLPQKRDLIICLFLSSPKQHHYKL
jgi:hypothetical protein